MPKQRKPSDPTRVTPLDDEPDERIEWGDADWGDDDEKGWNEPVRRTLVRKFLAERWPAVAIALGLVLLALVLYAGKASAMPLSMDGSNGGFGPSRTGQPCPSWQYGWGSTNGYGEQFVCAFFTWRGYPGYYWLQVG